MMTGNVFSNSLSVLWSLSLSLCLLLLLGNNSRTSCHASITIVDSGKTLVSKVEHKLGQHMWKGYEYMARLQFVHGNLQLCQDSVEKGRKFQITTPSDLFPVTLYAKTGGCSLEEKALVASTLIDPPNLVAYLIIDDGGRRKRKKMRRGTGNNNKNNNNNDNSESDKNELEFEFEFEMEEDDEEHPFWAEQSGSSTDEDLMIGMWETIDKAEKETALDVDVDVDDDAEDGSSTLGLSQMIMATEEALMNDDESAPVVNKKVGGDGDYSSMLHSSIVRVKKEEEEHQQQRNKHGQQNKQEQELYEELDINDDDSAPIRFKVIDEEGFITDDQDGSITPSSSDDGDENGGSGSGSGSGSDSSSFRVLRSRHHNKNHQIKVAILHVTHKVGYELLDVVLKEKSEMRQLGGSKLLLNSKEPSASAKSIFWWSLLSMAIAGGGCCCLMLFVHQGMLDDEQNQAPARPVRRRLTHQQVRENYPAFCYEPERHGDLEECAVCLDEYEPGVRCRQLPCQHVYHSACIGRWLIERSSTCPLCKIDLYEDEEDEEEESEESGTQEVAPVQSLLRLWGHMTTRQQPSAATTSATTTNTITTANAATPATPPLPPQQQLGWWQRPSGPVTTINEATAPNVNRSSSWWHFSSSSYSAVSPSPPAINTNIDGSNDDTETTGSRTGGWRMNYNWFGGQRRRPMTEGAMLLTELTEPLMAGETSSGSSTIQEDGEGDAEAPTPPEELRTLNTGSSISPPSDTPPTPTDITQTEESTNPQSTSTQAEI